jgi:hypothetical protein
MIQWTTPNDFDFVSAKLRRCDASAVARTHPERVLHRCGAAHPDEYSVTRLFYDRGRYGINFEPLPFYFEKLAAARPRDLNLNIALSNEPDEVPRFTTPLRALKRRMNV